MWILIGEIISLYSIGGLTPSPVSLSQKHMIANDILILDNSNIIYFVNASYGVSIVEKNVFFLKAIVYLKKKLKLSAVTYMSTIS